MEADERRKQDERQEGWDWNQLLFWITMQHFQVDGDRVKAGLSALNLFPAFRMTPETRDWEVAKDTLLQGIPLDHKDIGRRHCRDLRRLAGNLSERNAPCALFDLSGRLDPPYLQEVLNDLAKREAGINLVIVDARQVMLRRLDFHSRHLMEFLRMVERTFGGRPSPPGVLLITDDPTIWRGVQIELKQQVKEHGTQWARHMLDNSRALLTTPEGWLSQEESRPIRIRPRQWEPVPSIDPLAESLVKRLWQMKSRADRVGLAHDEARLAAKIFANLAEVSVPPLALMRYFRQNPHLENLRRHYDWHEARTALARAEQLLEPEDHDPDLQVSLPDTFRMVIEAWCQDRHPYVQAVNRVVFSDQSETPTVLVVRKSIEAELWREHRLPWLTVTTSREFDPGQVDETYRVVYADFPEQLIDLELFNPRRPANAEWVLAPGQPSRILRYLDGLEQTPGMESLQDSIQAMKQPLETALKNESIRLLGKARETTISIDRAYSHESDYEPGLFIQFEGDRWIARGRSTEFVRASTNGQLELVDAGSLDVGDLVLDITPCIREEIRGLIDAETLEKLKIKAEAGEDSTFIKGYHNTLRKLVEIEGFEDQDEASWKIFHRIQQDHPDIAREIDVSMVKRWLDPAYKYYRDGKARAPGKPYQVEVFCKALGMPRETAIHMRQKISSYRGARRTQGRRLNDVIIQLMMHPDIVPSYHAKSGEVMRNFRDRLLRGLETITRIHYKEDLDDPRQAQETE